MLKPYEPILSVCPINFMRAPEFLSIWAMLYKYAQVLGVRVVLLYANSTGVNVVFLSATLISFLFLILLFLFSTLSLFVVTAGISFVFSTRFSVLTLSLLSVITLSCLFSESFPSTAFGLSVLAVVLFWDGLSFFVVFWWSSLVRWICIIFNLKQLYLHLLFQNILFAIFEIIFSIKSIIREE